MKNPTLHFFPSVRFHVRFAISLLSAAGVVWPSLAWAAAAPPPFHYVAQLGFVDARHTAADGFQYSDVVALAEGDFAIGTSELFVGTDDIPDWLGRRAQSAWVADAAGATRRVGLYDATHTRDDGRQEAYPLFVNDDGVSAGASARFGGHADAGQTAWVATRAGQTLVLGYYDAAHTGGTGRTISAPVALNQANKLIGYSLNPDNGHRTGWIANAVGQFNPIGLTDAAHTAADGHRASFPTGLNDSGMVVGNSDYFVVDELFPGSTAWLRRTDRSMRLIGFQSGVHLAGNGQHQSRVTLLTNSGYAGGWSTRYGAAHNDGIGQTAWLTHQSGPNRPVGFYTGVHLAPNGVAHSAIAEVNESGQAIGTSFQYVGTNPDEFDQAGSTAWIATAAGETVRAGLYDAEHTANGRNFNEVVALNETGSLTGWAVRYLNGNYNGSDAWVANAAGQVSKLGLVDSRHTRNDGYHASIAGTLTESGFVAGSSERYQGGSTVGRTAWIYRRGAGTYVRFELSVRASDGFADSFLTALREDGAAAGYYRRFGSDGSDQGERAFVYLPGKGVFTLDAELDVDPAAAGWNTFARASQMNTHGLITGTGLQVTGSTGGQGAFLVSDDAVGTGQATLLPLVRVQLRLP